LRRFFLDLKQIQTAYRKKPTPPGSPAEATPPQTPDTAWMLQARPPLPRPSATFFGPPETRAKGGHASAPDPPQKKVGVESNVVTVSIEKFQLLKFELEETQRTISLK